MKKHWDYLKYIIRHKWFVFLAGIKIGCPIYRLIIHDLSKFLPSEWFPYVEYFYGGEREIGTKEIFIDKKFNKAWLKHQHRNPHHWQYWVLREDDGETVLIEIPHKYVYEMIADWAGAGRAIKRRWGIKKWYENNKDKIILHGSTKEKVETCIVVFESRMAEREK